MASGSVVEVDQTINDLGKGGAARQFGWSDLVGTVRQAIGLREFYLRLQVTTNCSGGEALAADSSDDAVHSLVNSP